jgi:hypothetical protein
MLPRMRLSLRSDNLSDLCDKLLFGCIVNSANGKDFYSYSGEISTLDIKSILFVSLTELVEYQILNNPLESNEAAESVLIPEGK